METLTRLRGTFLGLGFVVAAVFFPTVADAAPFDARVLWSRGDRAYIVARDSVWVTAGSRLRFFEKKKEVASGVVLLIEDSTLVVATITTGSLARVKHLDRIHVEAEPGTSAAMNSLRIGYPSSARIQPFFECRRMTLDPRGYRVDTLSVRSYRLVRTSSMPTQCPDTVLVRMFDDEADEEIALERGELDVAVFWPGEASAHIRQQMRWNGTPRALRTRGAIGIHSPRMGPIPDIVDGIPAVEQRTLDRLNAELFRGDLERIHAKVDSSSSRAWTYDFDPALPGRESIRRVLVQTTHPSESAYRVRLTFVDDPTDQGASGSDTDPIYWLYLLGCPVISRPELRPYLESIDLSAIVNLFDCETTVRKP